jgi:alpha-methylacyl-CoA racemase
VVQPAPAPRLSRTPPAIARPPAVPGRESHAVLLDSGLPAERVEELIGAGTVVDRAEQPADR